MTTLFSAAKLGDITLQNHLVMAPLTRSRALGNLANDLMAKYYAQRASAGLIITEGMSPSPNGLGYPRIPGLFNEEQASSWVKVTDAVHQKGGKIFCQLMHTGRVTHPLNLPEGGYVLAPSAIAPAEQMYTDQEGMKDVPVPKAMSLEEIASASKEYVNASSLAVTAGFDGVELHAANGYLLEQFFRPCSNQRNDEYGGPVENRARFILETAAAVVAAIGKNKVGIRISPFGVFNSMVPHDDMVEDYLYLVKELNALGLAYVHIVDHAAMGAPEVPDSIKVEIRKVFKGVLILSGGYDAARAEADIADGKADLIAVGRPFIANPDLVARWQSGKEENALDADTLYTADAKGYTDYPALV